MNRRAMGSRDAYLPDERQCHPAGPFRLRAVAIAVALVMLSSAQVGVAQTNVPRKETWVTNGQVNAIVTTPTTVYVGGDFLRVAPYTGSAVPVDLNTGAPASSYPEVVGTVEVIRNDGSGGWYIGGALSAIGGPPLSNLAHVSADLTVDAAWTPNPSGKVFTLVPSGSTLYIGEDFTSVGGVERRRLAALDAATGAVLDWNPVADNSVRALAVRGSIVYAGGLFGTVGGLGRSSLAAIDAATGVPTAWDPDVNGEVYSLAISDDWVYIGGDFAGVGGVERRGGEAEPGGI